MVLERMAMRGRADPMCTETPQAREARQRLISKKQPSIDEVRVSIRSDAERLLRPLYVEAQQVRGMTKEIAERKCD